MALVLSATGLFLYLRLGSDLDRTIDQGLRARADEVTALVKQADSGLRGGGRLADSDETFAQILDAKGRVIDASSQYARRPLLRPGDLARAQTSTTLVDQQVYVRSEKESTRLLATPVRAQDQRLIVVVGSSLESRDASLRDLGTLLLVGGPVALLLAALAGYGLSAASLRTVESMRRRAEEISAAAPGRRLPVPPANDEIARLGHTLNDMLARLEVAFNRERTFVSDASHELRTPLAVLKAELELALRRGRSRQELEQAVRSAAEETDRLVQLAEDLLVIARSDQGGLPVRPARIDAVEVLNDVRDRFALRSEETARPIVVEEAAVELWADPLRLRQALGNLVDNALRYGQGPVRLYVLQANGEVELHVSDEGPGFPAAFLGKAFERFTRGDEGRGRGGSGLGLAIVEAIARAHMGRAGAANRSEGGADVFLTLAAAPPGGRAAAGGDATPDGTPGNALPR